MLRKYTSSTAHKMSGNHASMLPLTYGTAMAFMQCWMKQKTSRHYRAADYRHLLLVLPFILDSLFFEVHTFEVHTFEVHTFNQGRPGQPKLIDPCAELVAIVNTFLAWYNLFYSITPPKTTDNTKS